jgi:uncharacterized repeat protein (TIGR03803 family)
MLDTKGSLTTLYVFGPYGAPGGAGPMAGVIRDPAGNLYGTTSYGGTAPCASNLDCGTVFEIPAAATAP